MQRMDTFQNLTFRYLNSKQISYLAFIAAFVLHILLLIIKLDLSHPNITLTPTLKVLVSAPEPVEEEVLEPRSSSQPSQPQDPPVVTEEEVISPPSPTLAVNNIKDSIKPTIALPLINSDEVKQFIRAQTQAYIEKTPNAVSNFADTFTPPSNVELENRERVTPVLGGGNYKVRKNGVECETFVAVPLTFSEITGEVPLLSGSGRCKNLKKKIELVDKNGNIKNSNQYRD